jgi:hypothetical protein
VDEDQLGRIEMRLTVEPRLAQLRGVGPYLLAGIRCFLMIRQRQIMLGAKRPPIPTVILMLDHK